MWCIKTGRAELVADLGGGGEWWTTTHRTNSLMDRALGSLGVTYDGNHAINITLRAESCHILSLVCLDLSSGQTIPAIWHGAGKCAYSNICWGSQAQFFNAGSPVVSTILERHYVVFAARGRECCTQRCSRRFALRYDLQAVHPPGWVRADTSAGAGCRFER